MGRIRDGKVSARFLWGRTTGVKIKNDSYMYCTWHGVDIPHVPMSKRQYEDVVAEDSEYEYESDENDKDGVILDLTSVVQLEQPNFTSVQHTPTILDTLKQEEQSYHQLIESFKKEDTKVHKEEACMVCGRWSQDNDNVLLKCDHKGKVTGRYCCNNLCHLKCCTPPLEVVPKGMWKCSKHAGRSKKKMRGTHREK